MIESLAKNLVSLKKEFVTVYDGASHIQEVIPASKSELFPIQERDLELLHQFATKNPIYYNSYEKIIGDTLCIVYEGDINKFWLNSIQHGSSHAPFSPTWIMSAYVLSLIAKENRYQEIIDIGSGDGRIAFCAKVLGLESYSIEIDNMLVDVQKTLSSTVDFHPSCANAIQFDYSSLNLSNPVFFIGGLAQMGGIELASGVLEKITPSHFTKLGWVFAGTYSKKYKTDPKNEAGWGTLIEQNHLKSINTISLPTAWTFHETDETPYIFAETA
ncbi:MAG: hypothetical protein K5790_00885 [Nitrosopumilus sp.]|uniref:hypothetical protein n=1 Tax=Nitrosopumilus sp. TaxID=2024843 RepID=UPI00247E8F84|nr:hypothetical protein [Nitrosopumilus sp.]MCV0391830.1 hypothetical protein [Nitrosopumilus sp.]